MNRHLLLALLVSLTYGCASSGERRTHSTASSMAPMAIQEGKPRDKPAPARETRDGLPAVEPTVVSEPTYRDPLMRINRGIFWFNDFAYRYALIPLSKGYTWLVPAPPRRGIGNFFHNLKTPVYLANDLLQLKPKPFGQHLARFLINSTLGIGGLFDPASGWFKLERTRTGFQDTLARYGAGYGIYLVLPLLGPSDVRNGLGRVADYFLNPVPYLTDEPVTTGINLFDGLQEFAPSADPYKKLRREVKDPYIFFRNLYLQGVERDAEHQ